MAGSARRRAVLWVIAVVAVVALGGLLAVTQPWLAFIDTTVDEDFPVATVGPPGLPAGDAAPPTTQVAPPVLLATGAFVAKDKDASGDAAVYRIDGGQVLRLENFATSNGPDVFIVLSPHPASASNAVLGDGYLSLGPMKGNLGNQNYELPAGTDLADFASVVVWCEQFASAFGAADLTPA